MNPFSFRKLQRLNSCVSVNLLYPTEPDFLPFSFQILWHLYDQEVIQEDAILKWDDEKKEADESDKVFVKQAEKFIQVSLLFYLF